MEGKHCLYLLGGVSLNFPASSRSTDCIGGVLAKTVSGLLQSTGFWPMAATEWKFVRFTGQVVRDAHPLVCTSTLVLKRQGAGNNFWR